jgi:DNA gyrase subunit B
VVHEKPFYVLREMPTSLVEVALQYNDSYGESTHTFANNINTIDGGTHLSGFKSALTRTMNDYARRNGLLKGDETLSGEDVREGLTAIISVKLSEPQFEGQTKAKLGNAEVAGAVQTVVNEALGQYLEENPRPPAGSSRSASTPPAPARPPARRASWSSARAVWTPSACPASWPTAPSETRPGPSSTSSRATRPAARPSRDATGGSRRSCRCAARSSTSRRPGSTRCSRTTRSGRC